jgi:hypothetical protein
MHHVSRSLLRLVAATGLAAALFGVGLFSPAGITALTPVCAGAAYQHHATVIVTHLSGRPSPVIVCVGFDEDHISGSDLLDRSRIQWQSDAYQGQGAAVCQVDYEPQPPPSNSCLGHNNDPYWSIWTAPYGGSWAYAQRAITGLVIHDGDAEGLRYQRPDGAAPPDVVGAVCPPPAPPATHPPTAAASIPPAAAASATPGRGTGPGGGADINLVPGVTPAPSATPTPPPPDALQALAPTPTAVAAGRSQKKASSAEPAGRPVQVLGLMVAGLVAVILVGALLAQLVLPRLGG